MLTRRHIRIKVMQSVYSFSLKKQKELYKEIDFFKESVNQFFNLYFLLLGLIKALKNMIDEKIKAYSIHEIKKDKNYIALKRLSQNRILKFIGSHNELELILKNKIANLIQSKVLIDEPLKRHTTFGVGGSASIFVYPNNKEDLIKLLKFISKEKIKIFFMGSGSNLLISDNGFDGVIISLKKSFKNFEVNNSLEAKIGTGVMLGHMVRSLTKKSLVDSVFTYPVLDWIG